MKINKPELARLYIEEMKTDEEIAEILHCHKQTVFNSRKKLGIKSYKRWQRNICEPTQKQIEIIYSSLLGDGHISNGIKNNKPCQSNFEDKHCEGQKDYVFWKYEQLKSICVTEPQPVKNGDKIQWRIRTFHHPFFTELRKNLYPNGIKILKENTLDHITSLGLAVWYMDDGTLSKHGNHIKFCTCNFTESENLTLSNWMRQKFGINTEVKVYSGYRFLVVCLESRKNFIDIIKENVIPCMKYKTIFREFHTWTNT